MTEPKHFLDLDKFSEAQLRAMLDAGNAFRKGNARGAERPLEGKVLGCIFEKPSTRTRISFDVGMKQLGGEVVVMTPSESQLGRGESIADTARVLSRYVDCIMIRTTTEEKLLELAEYATVPVINGLTDRTHPCQLMADVMTYEQHRGSIKGKILTWSGDGNNMATSMIHAAVRFDFTLRLAVPEELPPPADVLEWAKREGGKIEIYNSPEPAAEGADCIVTDTWVSMGDKDAPVRHNLLQPFQVNDHIMSLANPDALFMHCLPAHRGEEVSESVIDGPQSVIWDEAENRMHAQKGVLAYCMGAL
ncbi:ornithine carbamoyltransferase [Aestuariispira insulae]|uniref:Ornithine carbamoyltransferase n=1 Tax=Aestuariispira insulae TaxID=1461337 RepID=A0A3D9HF64_9PROT|nr:ornithine carbamoyltransferase [Aestuariispira insulae]RED48113.1 ornithine carbamoyltransferase [Aestuariispira insulae]